MGAVGKERQTLFFEWLAKSVSPAQLSELYQAFSDMEEILLLRRFPHHLSKSLIETTTPDEVEQLCHELGSNSRFVRSYRAGTKLALLRAYARFCRETTPSESAISTSTAPSPLKTVVAAAKTIPTSQNGTQEKVQPTKAKAASSGVSPNAEQDKFHLWLQEKAHISAENVIETIRKVEQFAKRNHMQDIRILHASPAEMLRSVNRLLASSSLAKSEPRLYRDFRYIYPVLAEYIAEVVQSPSSVHHEDESVVAKDKPVQPAKKDDDGLEPALDSLLKDEQFAVLRNALLRQGVRTMDDFKKLNLWMFMNLNGLYSIGQRQAVFSALRRSMNATATNGHESRCRLNTLKAVYSAETPAGCLLAYCQAMAAKYPLRFRQLVGQRYYEKGFVGVLSAPLHGNDLRMENPTAWISSDTTGETALLYARWICEACRDNDMPQTLYSKDPVTQPAKPEPDAPVAPTLHQDPPAFTVEPEKPTKPVAPVEPAPVSSPLQKKVEKIVLESDLAGITLDRVYEQIPGTTMVALRQIRDSSPKLVEICDRLIHVDAFVDWKKGADKLEEILEKLFSKNNGYVSYSQLYEYARAEMQMFLNDNDMDDQRKVFDMAEHLFGKVGYHGKHYTFWMKTHISRSKEAVTSNLDVVKKYAQEHNGFFRYDDLVAYLEQIGVKTGNLRGQMQLGIKPVFFYYSSEEILYAGCMNIDAAWLDQAKKALERLFADVGDHIVLRSINPVWYDQMPTLPGYIPWTPLLLQYILQFYGKKLGAKTISTKLNQKYDVLHAMLVTQDSEVQTFADAVVAYLVDSGIDQRQFEAEELRGHLLDGGLIAGNELIYNVSKAIGTDPRFAWDASGGRVNIKV